MRVNAPAFAATVFLVAVTPAAAVECTEDMTYLSSTSDVYAYLEGQQYLIYDANPDLVNDPIFARGSRSQTRSKLSSN